MTHPSPQPPSQQVFRLDPVRFGEQWAEQDGHPVLADADGVRITILNPDGTPMAAVFQTPEQAIGLGVLLSQAANRAIGSSIDDDGKRPGMRERLARLDDAYKRAGR